MAVVQYTQCDMCQSKDDVQLCEISWGRKTWMLDLCSDCVERYLGDVTKRGGKPRTRAFRKKNTYVTEKIEIGPENL